MTGSTHDELIWQQALDWVLREHEQPLNESVQAGLRAWLDQGAAQRQAYDKARYVWLLTGLVPPSPPGDAQR